MSRRLLFSLSLLCVLYVVMFVPNVLSRSNGAPCSYGGRHVKYPKGHRNSTNQMDKGVPAPYVIEVFYDANKTRPAYCYNLNDYLYVRIAGVDVLRGFLMAGVCYCKAIRGTFHPQRGVSQLQCRNRATHITHVDGKPKTEVTAVWLAPPDYTTINKKMRFVALVVKDYNNWWAYIESQPLTPCNDYSTAVNSKEEEYANYDGDYYYET